MSTASTTPLLEARNLTTLPQLFGVDFTLERGAVATLDGPTPEARTALVHALAGLRHPDEGAVLLDGVRLDRLTDHELSEVRRRDFGFLFSDGMLVPELNAQENCALPQMLAGTDRAEAMARALRVLRDFGLDEMRERFPGQLSAAQVQRLTVARAMAHRPKVLFADDPSLTESTISALVDTAREAEIAVVLATAEPSLTVRAQRPVRLNTRAKRTRSALSVPAQRPVRLSEGTLDLAA
ncbi:ABC transporter ATP-binding protein [Saccharopolyspora gloriosae]|uniref:ABC transporter ATP-binding protein n=1 Tax=Saccharopolyspora gloriosae TaxID=455344 RepID=UPI001FB78F5E|nr:ATP-binding cassette domain-containing protein [Saccharopolyspora gloriosae]